ncbi:MAG: hypothetical protein JNM31_00200 [Flavobacteriales bacterium]|nr:hypothetical protein [Flavobacteriales bacterium]
MLVLPFSGCDKEQEADKVYLNGTGGTGGGGGGTGGGGGGTNSGPVDPATIDINSEPIWACDGNGTDYVCYDSTSWHSQLLSIMTSNAAISQFALGDVPYAAQVQLYGFTWSGADPTQAEMDAFFAPGARPFTDLSLSPGVLISMTPSMSGNPIYQSNLGAQPSSSSFTITDVQPYPFGSFAGVKVRAVWQCTLKSTSGSDVQCVDGIFVGYFTGDAN